jgi:hypothetical protein
MAVAIRPRWPLVAPGAGLRRAAALAVGVILAGCGLAGPPPAERSTLAEALERDDIVGPPLLLGGGTVQGQRVEAVAIRVESGNVCVYEVSDTGVQGPGCGPPQQPERAFGPIGTTRVADDAALLWAFTSDAVDGVEIEIAGRRESVDVVSLDELGLPLRGFATVIGWEADPTALVAIDGNGDVVDRFELAQLRGP